MIQKTDILVLSLAAGIGTWIPAYAQNNVDRAASDTTLKEIVVTAEKREQRLIDVPTPVTALSASDLLENNKTRLEDYFRDVPGLTLSSQGSGSATLAVRGVTTGSTTNPTVGITIDDVPYGSVSGLAFGSFISPPDLDPTDLQRIEVLRGPQGTLYGASSLGGLLKFVTADPKFSGTNGRIEVGANSISGGGTGGSARGAMNTSLSDSLALRVSGFYRRDGGYIDDTVHSLKDVDSGQAEGGHASLLWKIGERASLKLSALYQKSALDGAATVDTDSSLVPLYGDLQQSRPPGTGAATSKAQMYSANFMIEFSGLKFVSLSGFAINDYHSPIDFTPEFGPFTVGGGAAVNYQFKTKRLSQEFRLERTNDSLDWLVGAFYTRERSTDHITLDDLDFNSGALLNQDLLDENDAFRYTEWAGFASSTWHVAQSIDLQGGLRYSHNSQFYRTDLQGILGGGYVFSQGSSDHSLTFSISPSYKISKDLLAYIRVASGYRPGGPNAGVFGPGTPVTYTADKTVNYELGIKGTVLDNRLTFDASVYYVRWKDIQLGSIDPTTGFLYFQNGKTASSKGIELSATARPWTRATVTASATVGKANLEENLPPTAAFGRSGDRLPGVPKSTVSLNFEQDFPVNEAINAYAGFSINYMGSRVGPFANTAPEIRPNLPSYTLGGLRAGIRTNGGWNAGAFVTNVSNKRGVSYSVTRGFTALPSEPFSTTFVQPRTLGVSISKTF